MARSVAISIMAVEVLSLIAVAWVVNTKVLFPRKGPHTSWPEPFGFSQSFGVDENSTTTTIFYGYYDTRSFPGGEGVAAYICPVFVASESDDLLYRYLANLVVDGNTVDAFDSAGTLLITINLHDLDGETRNKIVKSSAAHGIKLKVTKNIFAGKNANTCASFIRILAVQ